MASSIKERKRKWDDTLDYSFCAADKIVYSEFDLETDSNTLDNGIVWKKNCGKGLREAAMNSYRREKIREANAELAAELAAEMFDAAESMVLLAIVNAK